MNDRARRILFQNGNQAGANYIPANVTIVAASMEIYKLTSKNSIEAVDMFENLKFVLQLTEQTNATLGMTKIKTILFWV